MEWRPAAPTCGRVRLGSGASNDRTLGRPADLPPRVCCGCPTCWSTHRGLPRPRPPARRPGSQRRCRLRSLRWRPSARAARGPAPAGRSPRPGRCSSGASSSAHADVEAFGRADSGARARHRRRGAAAARPSTCCSRSARPRATSPSSRRSSSAHCERLVHADAEAAALVAEGAVKAIEALVRANLSVTPDDTSTRIARVREAAGDAARRAGETA